MLNIILNRETVRGYLEKYYWLKKLGSRQKIYEMIVEAEFRKICYHRNSQCDNEGLRCIQCSFGVRFIEFKIWLVGKKFFKDENMYRIWGHLQID